MTVTNQFILGLFKIQYMEAFQSMIWSSVADAFISISGLDLYWVHAAHVSGNSWEWKSAGEGHGCQRRGKLHEGWVGREKPSASPTRLQERSAFKGFSSICDDRIHKAATESLGGIKNVKFWSMCRGGRFPDSWRGNEGEKSDRRWRRIAGQWLPCQLDWSNLTLSIWCVPVSLSDELKQVCLRLVGKRRKYIYKEFI